MEVGLKFTEEDKKKFVEFLNFIAKHARFPELETGGVDTKFCIEYFKQLNFMQTTVLKKIDANILEYIATHESETAESSKE